MLVQIRHDNPQGKRFDVYSGNKKLKSGEEYDLPSDELKLAFIESNPFMTKFWFLRIFAYFIAGLISGSFNDFKDARRTRTVINVRLIDIFDDEIEIHFTGNETIYKIIGATKQTELNNGEQELPQVEKRIKIYKATILIIALLAVVGVLFWLIAALS